MFAVFDKEKYPALTSLANYLTCPFCFHLTTYSHSDHQFEVHGPVCCHLRPEHLEVIHHRNGTLTVIVHQKPITFQFQQ